MFSLAYLRREYSRLLYTDTEMSFIENNMFTKNALKPDNRYYQKPTRSQSYRFGYISSFSPSIFLPNKIYYPPINQNQVESQPTTTYHIRSIL